LILDDNDDDDNDLDDDNNDNYLDYDYYDDDDEIGVKARLLGIYFLVSFLFYFFII
jgi:hypothetical protein